MAVARNQFVLKKRCKFISKKSQITIFIILGIMLIISIGFVIVMRGPEAEIQEKEIIKPTLPKVEKGTFEIYVKNCIRDTAIPLIIDFAKHGGTLDSLTPLKDARVYYNAPYRYLCAYDLEHGCVNKIITRNDMEQEINELIEQPFLKCVNLDAFTEQNYKIETGLLAINTTINVDDVAITLNYPMKISRGELLFELETFSEKIEVPLGRLYDLAVQITNSEIVNRTFDKDEWMYKKGVNVIIEKHKPYPDIIYRLNKYIKETNTNLTFNFAIQGYDTVALIGSEEPISLYNYCYFPTEKNCFANSDKNRCESKGGISVETPLDCSSPTEFTGTTLCDGQQCNNCNDKRNGETWCLYDSISGAGLDRAGSRHFKQSCINGKTYTEECRDFREELCTTKDNKAVCRENRWQDCALQNNLIGCQNEELRDCIWYPLLFDTKNSLVPRCGPIVPPGFRFWAGEGMNVCAFGNDVGECPDTKTYCPDNWDDSAAQYCYSIGDCGNYLNYLGQLTETGFYNSDLIAYDLHVRPILYYKNLKADDSKIDLATGKNNRVIANYDNHPYPGSSYIAHATTDEITGFVNDYIDKVLDWEICDIFECDFGLIPKRPLYKHFKKYVIGISFCLPWGAPPDGDCEQCNEDPVKPCGEYRCRSISKICNYYEDISTGIGKCETPRPSSTTLTVEVVEAPEGYNFVKDYFAWKSKLLVGKKLMPKVGQDSVMTLKVNTNQDATCWIAPLPEYLDTFIGGGQYSKEHNLTMNIPGAIELYLKKIQSLMSISSFSQGYALPDSMTASDYLRFEDMLKDTFPDLSPGELRALQASLEKIITDADSRKFYMFIKCMDKFGNINNNNYITFDISSDDKAPTVKIVSPGRDESVPAGTIDFTYKPKDNMALKLSCSLWYNSTTEEWHKRSALLSWNNIEVKMPVELAAGTYTCSISCTDGFNEAFGEKRTLIVT